MTAMGRLGGLILALALAGEAHVGSCFQIGAIPSRIAGSQRLGSSRAMSSGRLRGGVTMQAASGTDPKLKERIATFYDQSSGLWESVWGEHMHMGHYGWEGDEKKGDQQAQIDMVDRLLEFGNVTASSLGPGAAVLDVGCGVGGSSRHMAKAFGCKVTGITLSPVQAQHAADRSDAVGLSDLTDFRVADALDMPFPDASFDLIWSLEVAEHFPDRQRWLEECWRVLKPGGRLLVACWTHKECEAITGGHKSNEDLAPKDRKLLDKICKYYALPEWVQLRDYQQIAGGLGFTDGKVGDWTKSVGPFWPAVWRTALTWKGISGLASTLKKGFATLLGARAVLLMIKGFRRGLITLSAFTFVKPK